MTTTDITPIVSAVIVLLSAIITSVIVPWIKSKTTAEQQKTIRTIAETGVFAAQKLYADNTAKKSYALDYMKEALNTRGLSLSYNEMSTQIEAALKDIKLSLSEDADW